MTCFCLTIVPVVYQLPFPVIPWIFSHHYTPLSFISLLSHFLCYCTFPAYYASPTLFLKLHFFLLLSIHFLFVCQYPCIFTVSLSPVLPYILLCLPFMWTSYFVWSTLCVSCHTKTASVNFLTFSWSYLCGYGSDPSSKVRIAAMLQSLPTW
jgi:hypothetical protein